MQKPKQTDKLEKFIGDFLEEGPTPNTPKPESQVSEKRDSQSGMKGGPMQELARLKNEIKEVHNSLRGFDIEKHKENRKKRFKDYEESLMDQLKEINENAGKPRLPSQKDEMVQVTEGLETHQGFNDTIQYNKAVKKKALLDFYYEKDESSDLERDKFLTKKLLNSHKDRKNRLADKDVPKDPVYNKMIEPDNQINFSNIKKGSNQPIVVKKPSVAEVTNGASVFGHRRKSSKEIVRYNKKNSQDNLEVLSQQQQWHQQQSVSSKSGFIKGESDDRNNFQSSKTSKTSYSVKREFYEDYIQHNKTSSTNGDGKKPNGIQQNINQKNMDMLESDEIQELKVPHVQNHLGISQKNRNLLEKKKHAQQEEIDFN